MDWNPQTFLVFMITLIGAVVLLVLFLNLLRKNRKTAKNESRYPSRYVCLDGDIARSLSECLIDNFLYRNGIQHKPEDLIVKSAERKFKYDWFLPEIDMYIEFFGKSDKKYLKNSDVKRKFYRQHGLKMIEILPQDLANLDETLPPKFGKLWEKIATGKHCPNCGESLDRRV